MINTADISVIIQGPILGKSGEPDDKQITARCIASIKQHLPGAEIIISTWQDEDVSHLDFDRVTYSNDPGAITYNDHELKGVYNNNNRQITSTFAGLRLATRKYAVKMRGDFYFENANFTEYLGKYTARRKYNFFSERVLVPVYFFRNPEKMPLLYHVSDIFQAGLTADLVNMWDIPLQPEPETTRAYDYRVQFANDPFRFNQYKMRYASEQYVWYAFAKKMGLDLSLKYFCEVPLNKIGKAVVSTIDSFVILSPEQLGLKFPERLLHGDKKLYTHGQWHELYEKLCVKKSGIRLFLLILKVKLVSANYIFRNFMKTLKGK